LVVAKVVSFPGSCYDLWLNEFLSVSIWALSPCIDGTFLKCTILIVVFIFFGKSIGLLLLKDECSSRLKYAFHENYYTYSVHYSYVFLSLIK